MTKGKKQNDSPTMSQALAEKMAKFLGSWKFLILQSMFLGAWVIFNVVALGLGHWDPYPFVFMNLMLSLQAAYTGPLLLIASNRQSQIDERRNQQILLLTERIDKVIKKQEKEVQKLYRDLEGN